MDTNKDKVMTEYKPGDVVNLKCGVKVVLHYKVSDSAEVGGVWQARPVRHQTDESIVVPEPVEICGVEIEAPIKRPVRE